MQYNENCQIFNDATKTYSPSKILDSELTFNFVHKSFVNGDIEQSWFPNMHVTISKVNAISK